MENGANCRERDGKGGTAASARARFYGTSNRVESTSLNFYLGGVCSVHLPNSAGGVESVTGEAGRSSPVHDVYRCACALHLVGGWGG